MQEKINSPAKTIKILSDLRALKILIKKTSVFLININGRFKKLHNMAATAKNNKLIAKTPSGVIALNNESTSKVNITSEINIKIKYKALWAGFCSFKPNINKTDETVTRKKDIKNNIKSVILTATN